ncbi:kinase C delta type-like [Pelobates cultripes]|uniref:Kinase C delta type-like n=1 Tax=Pelobates cultripes TaxID=61616 RepID=A0AAD1TGK6_PELCU|nr:kinase C delta type-like [Pelobates cultripes]
MGPRGCRCCGPGGCWRNDLASQSGTCCGGRPRVCKKLWTSSGFRIVSWSCPCLAVRENGYPQRFRHYNIYVGHRKEKIPNVPCYIRVIPKKSNLQRRYVRPPSDPLLNSKVKPKLFPKQYKTTKKDKSDPVKQVNTKGLENENNYCAECYKQDILYQPSSDREQALKRSRGYEKEEEQGRQKKRKVSSRKKEDENGLKEEIGKKKCFKKTNKPKTSEDECIAGGSGQSVVESKKPLPLSFTSYRFHKVLGQGNFGKVMLASSRGTNQFVAIKVIKKTKVKEKIILKEKRILRMVSGSPFLCQGLAAFQSQEHVFLVMEYIPGGSLTSYMKGKERLSMAEARFYGQCLPELSVDRDALLFLFLDRDHRSRFFSANLACGIQFLHSRGILHRDLKPDNILLDPKGYVKIADFGLSLENIFTYTTIKGQAGTLWYMAPEVLSGNEYGQSADWWSFGVILCRMITGQFPFNTNLSRMEYINEISNTNPHYPTWLCSDLTDILNKILDKVQLYHKFLDKDHNARSVAGRSIQEHPFYRNMNWEDLQKGKVSCPFLTMLTPDLETGTTGKYFSFMLSNTSSFEEYVIHGLSFAIPECQE